MNCKMRVFFIVIFLGVFSLQAFSQNRSLSVQNLAAVNIDEVPDSEIKAYWLKAAESGLSEQNIYRLLLEKGLPEAELNKLSSRVELIFSEKSAAPASNAPGTEGKNNQPADRFSAKDAAVPMQKSKSDLTIFGAELFAENSLVFEPNLRIATPMGYILGPDDELLVNVFGYSEKTYNLTVNEEGNIYIPQVGPIFVNGLSIEQASTKIKNKLSSTIYKAIRSGQTRVQITLGKIRSIRVTVIGEAKKPGTYTISSLTTVFNLLYLCGGPSDMGSYRSIELIRGNQVKQKIDLYAFLLKGDQTDNILLQEGDVVRIPYYHTRVILNGHVKHQGKYEVMPAESFADVLGFCGGFADDAYKTAVTVYQLTDSEKKITDLTKEKYSTYNPMPSDSFVVGKLLDRFANKLVIKGAVIRPGEYELTNNMQLKDLLLKAGGVKQDAYSNRATISRLNNNGTPAQLSFNVDSVLNDQTQLALKKYDSITVYSIFDLENEVSINIDGQVNKPGRYKWADNITLKDMLLTAGGVTESGDLRNIEIARRIDNVNLKQLDHQQTEIITINLADAMNGPDVILKPFDVINVRQKPEYAKQRTVLVEGMVTNPGRYTLKMSGDKISDILERAGWFRANADTTALVIKRLSKRSQVVDDREKVFSKLLNIKADSLNTSDRIRNEIYKEYDKISINLNAALENKKSPENMLLEDGDILTIEQNTNLVKVSGEVYFPTIIPFEKGASLKYYIQKSGSYTDQARKGGTLVIYPDGKAKKVKHFLFFKSYPQVVPRSEVFVPQKSEKNKDGVSLAEWSVILSSLAIVANVIINLKN
jgi:protein involved in polysaccharide export with SLBB domain